jgi:hypothetical protein
VKRLSAIAAALVLVLAGTATAADVDEMVEQIRQAHMSRDEAAIAAAEKALVARGVEVIEAVRAAFERDRQFNVKVSLEYVLLGLEGKASARDVLALMRETTDPSRKMRLAFLFPKLISEEDTAALEEALATETDPMIAKHILRALATRGVSPPLKTTERVEDRVEDSTSDATRTTRTLSSIAADPDSDPTIRAIAVRGLAEIGGREAVAIVRRVIHGRADR